MMDHENIFGHLATHTGAAPGSPFKVKQNKQTRTGLKYQIYIAARAHLVTLLQAARYRRRLPGTK
tara:strand:- start:291 stop:485 length:195 start_codon:yes stop_codon:yes gene_type:complete